MRWLLTILLVILSVFIYLHYLNPQEVNFYYLSDKSYRFSLSLLIFLSFISGIFVTFIMFLIRDIKGAINNWKRRRENIKKEKTSELYYKGIDYFLSGDYESAKNSLNKAINRNPNNINSYLKLADIYMNEGDYNEAIKILYKGRIVDQNNIDISLKLAESFQNLKDFEMSIDTLKNVNDKDQRVLKELIKCYIELKDWENAYKVGKALVHILNNDDKEKDLLLGVNFEYAMKLFKDGDSEGAIKILKEIIKTERGFIPAYVSLGDIYYAINRLDEASKIWERGFYTYKLMIFLFRLEESYLKEEQPNKIIEIYQSALSKDPDNHILRLFFGKLCLRLEMIDDAMLHLKRIESNLSDYSYLHILLGETYLRRGKFKEASDEFKSTLEIKKKIVIPFLCSKCNEKIYKWEAKCPSCKEWNTLFIYGEKGIN